MEIDGHTGLENLRMELLSRLALHIKSFGCQAHQAERFNHLTPQLAVVRAVEEVGRTAAVAGAKAPHGYQPLGIQSLRNLAF